VRKLLFSGTSAVALTASLVAAQAAGFATRDQSAVGEGMAFAGEGTPGMGLSAMFWNPAAVTQVKGWGVEGDVSVAVPNGTITTNTALTSPSIETLNSCTGGPATCDQTGNMFRDKVAPAFYGAVRVAPDWYLGLSVNSPFGVSTKIPGTGNPPAPLSYAAQQLGTGANIRSVDVNPVVGWKVNNVLSVAVGPQLLWWRNDFDRDLLPIFSGGGANLEAMIATQTRAFGAGITAGITYTPSPATEIALGYRSQVRLDLKGQINIPPSLALLASPVTAPFSGTAPSVTSSLTLPDQVNLGARQRINDAWTLLGTIEWTHWSGTQGAPFVFTNGPTPGAIGDTLSLNYRDGWYLSAGAEYRATAATTLRAGIGYDVSPVQGTLGWINIPGANSTSASIGLSHKLTDRLTFDVGYSYTWIANQTIIAGPGNPDQTKLDTLIPGVFNTWAGNVASHSQAVSVALRYDFAEQAAHPSIITKAK
jgi:long-chain fatty acid transport protein